MFIYDLSSFSLKVYGIPPARQEKRKLVLVGNREYFVPVPAGYRSLQW
jgi:hypothetical protein